jgi:hypothetical protein
MNDLTPATQNNEVNPAPENNKPKSPSPLKMRLRALVVLAGVSSLIGAAVYLDPDRLERHDKHYTLLKPCSVLVKTGYPCPTCYMTRSFAYMFHGRPDKAFMAQPFGAALSLMCVYLAYGAIYVLVKGTGWNPFWARWSRKRFIAIFLGAFLAGWIFKLVYGTFITHEFPLKFH